jgi:5-methylphenazine-1-carboxylate 1-monooxygenase
LLNSAGTMTRGGTTDVVIAGAGIGGLTTALALHARGIRATVLEAAREIRPLGVGINIQPPAVGELTTLGLGERLAATGIPTREIRHLGHTGTVSRTQPRGLAAGYPYPQYSIHRGELQRLLLEAVRHRLGPGAVRTGTRLHGFENTRNGVRAHAHHPATGTTVTYEGAALIGADGLHSAVRAALHPDQPPPSAAGVLMWRGLTELGGFLDGRTMILASDDHANRLAAYPISARHAERGRTLLNWVCMVPAPAASTEPDWNLPGRLDDVLPHYAHWDLGCLDIRHVLRRSGHVLLYPMVDRDPLARWGRDRVTLLGDAAHPMYPLGAEGGTQAVLDAAAVAGELAHHGDVAAALHRYEALRHPGTTTLVHLNRRMDADQRTRHRTVPMADFARR